MTPARPKPAASRSGVNHSYTEPLCSLLESLWIYKKLCCDVYVSMAVAVQYHSVVTSTSLGNYKFVLLGFRRGCD